MTSNWFRIQRQVIGKGSPEEQANPTFWSSSFCERPRCLSTRLSPQLTQSDLTARDSCQQGMGGLYCPTGSTRGKPKGDQAEHNRVATGRGFWPILQAIAGRDLCSTSNRLHRHLLNLVAKSDAVSPSRSVRLVWMFGCRSKNSRQRSWSHIAASIRAV